MDEVRLELDAARARRSLILVVAILALLSMLAAVWTSVLHHGRLYGAIDLLDVDSENSVSTFFQSTLMLGCAVLLWLVARTAPSQRARWILLAWLFGYLAVDEASQIHEILIFPLNRALGRDEPLVSLWLVPVLAVVAVLAIALIPWWRSLTSTYRRRFGVAAAWYLAGAVIMEGVNGWYGDRHGYAGPMYRLVLVTIEETLEGVGIVLFLGGLLALLGERSTTIGVDVSTRSRP